MSIINLTDADRNSEEIRLSSYKEFKTKSIYTNDISSLFNQNINDSSAITVNNFPTDEYTSYGLIPLYSYKTNRVKEIGNGGNTQVNVASYKKNILNNDNTENVFENQYNAFHNFNAPVIRQNVPDQNELNSNYFGIKRLSQELRAFSPVLNKKNIVKKLYKSNKCLSDGRFLQHFNYNFYNYNCFNFFNILPGGLVSQDYKPNFINNSHKNALIYSNTALNINQLTNNNKINLDINNSLSINFWINPKRTALINKKYNPGCILHIPNMISIYLVADFTKLNGNNQPVEFKILCLLGDDSNKLPGNNSITKFIQSNQNLILNTWHNISIVINRENVLLYIDDAQNSWQTTNNISVELNIQNNFTIFTIGNRLNNETSDVWSEINKEKLKNCFFNVESFKEQHINTSEINANYQTKLSNDLINWNTDIFDLDLNNADYSKQSQALNAELFNLMIFNDNISINILKDYAYGVTSVIKEKNLSFYLPCVYISDLIKRKGYITLGAKDNIAYRSFVNPYFAHRIYGHELSIESFSLDIVNLRKPYILGMNGQEYTDSLSTNAFNFGENLDEYLFDDVKNLKINVVNDFFKKHLSPTKILNKIMTSNLVLLDRNFLDKNMQFDNIVYRNNFILPCDNGLCKIDLNKIFELDKIKNVIGENSSIFYENNNPYYVNMNSLFESSKQYSFQNCDEFFNNNNLKDKIKFIYSFSNFTNELLFDTNNQNYIQKIIYDKMPDDLGLSSFFNKLKSFNKNKHILSNSIFKNIDGKYDPSINQPENINWTSKSFDNHTVLYSTYFNSHLSIEGDLAETHSVLFDISNLFYSSKIRNKNIEIIDVDLAGSGGALNIRVKDNGYGGMYRADCNGKHATWAHIGHAFYSDGLLNILHPGLSNFGENNFSFLLKGEHNLYTFQIDIPIERGDLNRSINPTYIKGLKPSGDLSDLQEENFVYLTGVNLHDENLNIVAKANFAQPIVKRINDRYNIRLKMDF